MTKFVTAFAFLLLATDVTMVPTAHAQEAAESDATVAQKVGANIKDEAIAIRKLAKAIKDQVEAGNITLTDEAKGKWKQGTELWEQITDLAKKEDYKAAYTKVREARRLMAEAFRTAFEGKPSGEIRTALKGYFDAVTPRVEGMKGYVSNHPELPADAKAAFEKGKVAWTEAKDFAKGKEYGKAFARMLDGMDELDQVIRYVYESKK